MMTLHKTFLAADRAGLCCIPAARDGTKAPWPDGPRWERYQYERPTLEQGERWFASGDYAGLGLVCGAVSGGLELLEFEGRAVAEGILAGFQEAARHVGLWDVLARVVAGYYESSPSGGVHLLWRCPEGVEARPPSRSARPPRPS